MWRAFSPVLDKLLYTFKSSLKTSEPLKFNSANGRRCLVNMHSIPGPNCSELTMSLVNV